MQPQKTQSIWMALGMVVMKIDQPTVGRRSVLKHYPNRRSYHVQVSTNMTYGTTTPRVDAVPLSNP